MTTRRTFLQSERRGCRGSGDRRRPAPGRQRPGVTDTEIKIGQTMPYSGPASAYGVIGKTEAAYFKMINEQGGVNGRKINFISLDDGYSPPKTVEQTRRLVEQEQVAFIFNTPRHAAQRRDPAISQRQQGAAALRRHRRRACSPIPSIFPGRWAGSRTTRPKRRSSASTSCATKPDAKIGVLYQNDGFGKDYLIGLKDGLGADHAGHGRQGSRPTRRREPTVDSQIVTLQGSGADVFVDRRDARNSRRRRSARPTTSAGRRCATSPTCRSRSPRC